MYLFRDLIKASKLNINGDIVKIAVLGNCSTQFFSAAIEGNCKLENLNASVFDAGYNQIELQLYDKASEVYGFKPDAIVLWISGEKLYEEFLDLNFDRKKLFADEYIEKIKSYWNFIKNYSKAKILQLNFCEIDDKVLGNYSAKTETAFIYQIRKLNFLLEQACAEDFNVFPIDLLSIQAKTGYQQLHDPVLYYGSKTPVSLNYLPCVSKQITDVLKSIYGKIKKCLIMDLDNTLWGGVIGDDGINNIEIGELGKGHAFTNLQKWIKQLKECGIILAVCSKNNEEIAKEPFEKHPDMVLRLSDISVFVANWNDKASNVRLIQETLNIGMDSIVFIDDNPFERNLIRQAIPEITVPELPEDPAKYLSYLVEQNYFETASFTGKNSDRTTQYQAQFERKKMEMTFDSIDEYLKNLEMVCRAEKFQEKDYSRIAQLTQRSNQFNLRTVRYTEDDIKRLATDNKYITLTFSLKDKFGDYGIVALSVVEKTAANIGFIDTWIMSCRALKRGLEEFTVNKIIELCGANGIEILNGEYIPTPKNGMVSKIYKEFGFKNTEENKYTLKIKEYSKKKNYITEG